MDGDGRKLRHLIARRRTGRADSPRGFRHEAVFTHPIPSHLAVPTVATNAAHPVTSAFNATKRGPTAQDQIAWLLVRVQSREQQWGR